MFVTLFAKLILLYCNVLEYFILHNYEKEIKQLFLISPSSYLTLCFSVIANANYRSNKQITSNINATTSEIAKKRTKQVELESLVAKSQRLT